MIEYMCPPFASPINRPRELRSCVLLLIEASVAPENLPVHVSLLVVEALVAPENYSVHVSSCLRQDAALPRGQTGVTISCPRRWFVFLSCDLPTIDVCSAPGRPEGLRYRTTMGSWLSMSVPVVSSTNRPT